MRILITSIVDLKKSQHNRPHQFVKYLSKKHEVTVLSINDWWKGGQDNLEAYSSEFDDDFKRIDYYYLTDKKVSPILQELLFRRKVKEVLKEEDFDVHLNYSTLISGYVAAKRVKTVYDLADDLGAMIKESPQIPRLMRPFGGILGDLMVRRNIEKAEKVTVTTDMLKIAYSIPDGKCEVISNGVDTNLFRNYGNAKEELGLDGFIIGYVGVLREWVNLEPVFGALKGLDAEIKMVVVGKEGGFNENVRLAKKCGVSDRVTFTGMVPYSQVPKYISAIDVCLIPFKKSQISERALPLKLFEYMACGKPVISTELPGIKNVAGEKVMYATNEKEYKERIAELYKNEELMHEMGKSGREFVAENYNWEKIVERMERTLLTVGEPHWDSVT
ncbi:MAG: glycosyltransferase family 4 protein [Halobacteriota archaeon]